ncbi:unnamed protein product [Adineta steineri]|uniref:Kinesin light chain n=1 Tax=Adineta steineri TaxID=433720 RepID=A0A814Q2T1_9BILA|nr:unnamed protein product [Adineta steineri]CAF1113671.1 unnamed protein product [Adineta steineri]
MSKDEIQILKNSIGEFISINSFFSTSLNYEQARAFLYSSKDKIIDDIEQVFFEINADSRLDKLKAFSKIHSLSYFSEEEVLFMLEFIFRLESFECDNEGIWNSRMVLCFEHEHRLETLFQHMKNEFDSGETNILVFSRLLRKMILLIIYQHKRNYNLALESYENALTIWKEVFGEDHPHVAICLNNISNVYRNEKKYSKALECVEKALATFQKHFPTDHSDLISPYGSIGNIHLCLNHHNQALQYYNLSLKIYEKCHPSQHPDIAITLSNISSIYEDKNEYQQALVYLERASDIYQHLLPSTHANVIQLEQSSKRVSVELK